MKKEHSIKSMSVDKADGTVSIKLNSKLYSPEIIYCAAYIFIDKAYIILDGDPEKEIIVMLKPKGKYDLKKLGLEFYNELLSYSVYSKKNKDSKAVRDAILQRAILTNESYSPQAATADAVDDKEIEEELKKIDMEATEEIKDIAVPWEDKYGKKKEE
jgi:His-Xaa-Ser system protein HxsD